MTNKITFVDGILYKNMMKAGARNLQQNVEKINALNVFPVPDGDTGTNMNLTFSAGIKEIESVQALELSAVSKAMARGLLMGARGNSGVILSQLFRGFAKSIENKDSVTVSEFAHALKAGVDTAYKAIMKPVEGTILTVSRDAADAAVQYASKTDDITVLMEVTLQEAKASLKRTKEILPILKQVGVVDSGAQGLVNVYEGMLSVLKGEGGIADNTIPPDSSSYFAQSKEEHVQDEIAEMMSDGTLSVEDIVYGYCTEFMVIRHSDSSKTYNEFVFREQLSEFGDSLLVISDDDLIKVHIHAENLSEVFSLAQSYGELTKIKIENMREQFRTRSSSVQKPEKKPVGIVAVGAGKGIHDLFLGLGVDHFVRGGQTMNPSTEDMVKAIKEANAETVFILPNNSNIILTAEQSAKLVDVNVIVIPSKNIQQGLAAMYNTLFNNDVAKIEKSMRDAITSVYSGQVTHAVRDTEINDVIIQKGDFMGIENGTILLSGKDIQSVTQELIEKMLDHSEGELVTIYLGEDVEQNTKQVDDIIKAIVSKDAYKEVEFQQEIGGQPVYPYLISVE